MSGNAIKQDFLMFLEEQANIHHNPLAVIVRYFLESAYDLASESIITTINELSDSPAASHFVFRFVQYRWIVTLVDHIGIGAIYPKRSIELALSINKIPPLDPPPFDHSAPSFIEACKLSDGLNQVFKTLCDPTSSMALRAATCIFGYGFTMSSDVLVLLQTFLQQLPKEEQKVSIAMAYAEEQLRNWLLENSLIRWRNIIATADHLVSLLLQLLGPTAISDLAHFEKEKPTFH